MTVPGVGAPQTGGADGGSVNTLAGVLLLVLAGGGVVAARRTAAQR